MKFVTGFCPVLGDRCRGHFRFSGAILVSGSFKFGIDQSLMENCFSNDESVLFEDDVSQASILQRIMCPDFFYEYTAMVKFAVSSRPLTNSRCEAEENARQNATSLGSAREAYPVRYVAGPIREGVVWRLFDQPQ